MAHKRGAAPRTFLTVAFAALLVYELAYYLVLVDVMGRTFFTGWALLHVVASPLLYLTGGLLVSSVLAPYAPGTPRGLKRAAYAGMAVAVLTHVGALVLMLLMPVLAVQVPVRLLEFLLTSVSPLCYALAGTVLLLPSRR